MEHIDIPPGERHAAHTFEYENAALRTAAAITDIALVNSLALQLDTGVYWRLTGVSPAVWRAVMPAISTDPDNRLTTGTDNALFVPEITVDPLAYYILSKA